MRSSPATELTGKQSASLATLAAKYGNRSVDWVHFHFVRDSDPTPESFDWWVRQAHTSGSLGEFSA